MRTIVTLTALSGGGKSEVFNYVQEKYPQFLTMDSYTSRLPRYEGEKGCIFKDKDYFRNHKDEFVELAKFPPGNHPDAQYYGKHISQFDGRDYITIFEEVGMKTLDAKYKANKLLGYKLIKIFVTCDDKLRLFRMKGDKKRYDRDKTRELLPDTFYDYVINNNLGKEQLHNQVDEIFSTLV